MMLVPPHGIVEPLAKVGFGPACLLVQPAQKLSGGLGVTLRAGGVPLRTRKPDLKHCHCLLLLE